MAIICSFVDIFGRRKKMEKRKVISKVKNGSYWDCQIGYGSGTQIHVLLNEAQLKEIEFKNKLESEIKMAVCSGAEELIESLEKDLDELLHLKWEEGSNDEAESHADESF